ncbi:MAG: DUF6290 family protein [Actinomycetes bacterium]|jgi:uncharacterized protein (DUF1778 family)|nr:DUF6290 family protein [Actinomycetes bacterium]
MTLTVRVNDDDAEMIRAYADLKRVTVSQLIRDTIIERIEDEYDIKIYAEAMAEYRRNPVTYTLDEVEAHLGLRS